MRPSQAAPAGSSTPALAYRSRTRPKARQGRHPEGIHGGFHLKTQRTALDRSQGPKRLLSLRSIATASSARPTVPAAAATAHDRLDLAVVGIRRCNSCAIGRRGRRARRADDTESRRKNDSHKDCSHPSTPFFRPRSSTAAETMRTVVALPVPPRPSSPFSSKRRPC
jgi:hypothetical protein